jgi:signal transduction histidine kinase
VAARCGVPVDLRVELSTRPPAAIETAAYFVVGEALTNVGKHSGASQAWVRLSQWGPTLRIEVTDDGAGGARSTPNGGLAGLDDRVKAVEGRLYLSSPDGGPTHLVVDLPWGGPPSPGRA